MENLDNWKKAGRIAAESLEYGEGLIKKYAYLLDVTNKIEQKVKQLGGNLAFPVQMSMNEFAAHFYPEKDDKTIFTDQLVSLDIGVHVDGCIGDTACTVDLSGNNKELVDASRKALDEAIKSIKKNVRLNEIGEAIEETIAGFGFKPVRNLSGHGLEPYNIHSFPTIPNFDNGDMTELKDQVIAIEPFATYGVGMIEERGNATLFAVFEKKPVRVGFVRDILTEVNSFNKLPFAKSWITGFSDAQINFALKQFKELGILKEYPPLVEKSNALVSQAEHTVYIGGKAEVLTKL